MWRGVSVLILVVSMLVSQAQAVELKGLVLYLPFDEGNGDVAYDLSGNGNNGKLVKNPKWVDGKIGKALEFDGSNYVEVPDSDTLDMEEQITIAAWIFPKLKGSQWQGVVTKGLDARENYELLINTGGFMHTGWLFDTGRVWANRGGAGTLSAEKWQHIAVTYKPGEWVSYLNGEVVDTKTNVKGKMVTDDEPLVVGDERPMNRLFQGIIDEVALFNRALSQDEIKEIMNGIKPLLDVNYKDKLATTWADVKRED